MRRSIAVPASVALVAWIVTWLVNRSLRRVEGPSMIPTLRPGDLVVVVPVGRVRSGQLVVVTLPDGRSAIKRVSNVLVDERVEVRGDNEQASTDSRDFGPLPRSSVTHRVLIRVTPWRRRGGGRSAAARGRRA